MVFISIFNVSGAQAQLVGLLEVVTDTAGKVEGDLSKFRCANLATIDTATLQHELHAHLRKTSQRMPGRQFKSIRRVVTPLRMQIKGTQRRKVVKSKNVFQGPEHGFTFSFCCTRITYKLYRQ